MAALLLQTIDSLAVSFPKGRATSSTSSACQESVSSISISVPSLSLQHHTHCSERGDRKQVEEYAASLLARPLALAGEKGSDRITEQKDKSCFRVKTVEQLRQGLLENATECFAVLVDCRLRAYATFLARHGITLAKKCESEGVLSMEQKVAALLDLGKSILARDIVLAFVPSTNDCLVDGEDDEDEDPVDSKVALVLRMDLQLELTRPSGAKQLLSVGISAPGFAIENQAGAVIINLNTRHLLESMIHQASNVVAAVVEVANTSSILAESKLSRSASFLAMPPPSKHQRAMHHGRKTRWIADHPTFSANSSSDDELYPVVSPDTRAVAASFSIPTLDLEGEHESPSDLEDLTPEACADLVDGILGDWRSFGSSGCNTSDDSLLPAPPPKKPRLIA